MPLYCCCPWFGSFLHAWIGQGRSELREKIVCLTGALISPPTPIPSTSFTRLVTEHLQDLRTPEKGSRHKEGPEKGPELSEKP